MDAIVTVVGEDQVGIIAKISSVMAEHKINILDISQTIMKGYFTMIMVVNLSEHEKHMDKVREILNKAGKQIGVTVHLQHKDVYEAMHRI